MLQLPGANNDRSAGIPNRDGYARGEPHAPLQTPIRNPLLTGRALRNVIASDAQHATVGIDLHCTRGAQLVTCATSVARVSRTTRKRPDFLKLLGSLPCTTRHHSLQLQKTAGRRAAETQSRRSVGDDMGSRDGTADHHRPARTVLAQAARAVCDMPARSARTRRARAERCRRGRAAATSLPRRRPHSRDDLLAPPRSEGKNELCIIFWKNSCERRRC
jgi:hypothetical protein